MLEKNLQNVGLCAWKIKNVFLNITPNKCVLHPKEDKVQHLKKHSANAYPPYVRGIFRRLKNSLLPTFFRKSIYRDS